MKIAIVGAAGKMGQWFASFLHSHGHELLLIGAHKDKVVRLASTMERCSAGEIADVADTDIIVTSVPIVAVESVMRDLAPHVRERHAVIDLSSLKVAPQQAADRHLPHATYLGVHPMFGPGADSLSGHNVILAPANNRARRLAAKVRSYIQPYGPHIVTMTPERHDEVMAIVLGMPALVVATVARTIVGTGLLSQSRDVSGTSLEVLMALTDSMLSEGSDLYSTLLSAMPTAPSIADALESNMAHFAGLVRARARTEMYDEFSTLGGELAAADNREGNPYDRVYAMLEALQRYPATPRPGAAVEDPPPPSTC
ncbi:MAG: prephenate dehydrogenase/arogenate dehydrogenase family protein [Dehalococcoidia bacterium]|nr:prephenate dehydrogenase/arogenate dehydrogenase family protein [Dehalococcoidia bacterium]